MCKYEDYKTERSKIRNLKRAVRTRVEDISKRIEIEIKKPLQPSAS